ncbi:MAG TPA: ubiquitin-like small modifier protein 1 [Candidatus Eisenbacteria bacterium]|jgi:MoaD family protein
MATRIRIPAHLRDLPGARAVVELPGEPATVADALAALWREFPSVRDRVMTETGEIRQHVQVFVGDESIRYTGGLATALPAGSEISIVPAVSGG